MLETVRELLTSDADPMVVSNCMSVIQKVSVPHPRPRKCHLHCCNPPQGSAIVIASAESVKLPVWQSMLEPMRLILQAICIGCAGGCSARAAIQGFAVFVTE